MRRSVSASPSAASWKARKGFHMKGIVLAAAAALMLVGGIGGAGAVAPGANGKIVA